MLEACNRSPTACPLFGTSAPRSHSRVAPLPYQLILGTDMHGALSLPLPVINAGLLLLLHCCRIRFPRPPLFKTLCWKTFH